MKKKYDVIIVGAGPAGIFAALELVEKNGLSVLMIEKGRDITKRRCPMKIKEISCNACAECGLLSGWGGAGAFSDGKLSLSTEVGGFLKDYVPETTVQELIDYVDSVYLRFGAPKESYGENREELARISREAAKYGLRLVPSRIRHIGTDRAKGLLKNMKEHLNSKVDILFDTTVREVLTEEVREVLTDNPPPEIFGTGAEAPLRPGDLGRKVRGLMLEDGREVEAAHVILAPGREGSKWLEDEIKRLELSVSANPVDLGVRVEVPASVMQHLTDITYEPKFIYYSKCFDDRVRTFCVNPHGEVVLEYLKGVWTVNGHSYARKKTENTNFALLVSTTFTEPFHEPTQYGRHIAMLANFLGQGVIVQRLGDLMVGRRSTMDRMKRGVVQPTLKDATPGDLSFIIPYRYLSDIIEMLEALDKLAPGVASRHTLLYGVEVKFYSLRPKLTNVLETEIQNLFAVGDGAGVSRGLVQASASGVIAAREILKRA